MFQTHLLTTFIKNQIKYFCNNSSRCKAHTLKPPWRILFFGTDEFSLASLKALHNEYRKGDLLDRLEVVTSIKTKKNAVFKFASQEKMIVHNWPISPPECNGFHVGFVVSFGHLIPKDIINAFPLGMLNVHASLLPRWRGAAPIVYALMNGDRTTGVTIMKIKPDKFDVGEIVTQSSIDIPDETRMPDLYNKLAMLGADTLVRTLDDLPKCIKSSKPQPENGVTFAPRVDSRIGHIKWEEMSAKDVCNLERSLTGMFNLITTFNDVPIKLLEISEANKRQTEDNKCLNTNIMPGLVVYDKSLRTLKVQCADGNWIMIKRIGVPGKRMSAADFNNGYISKQDKNKLLIFR